MDVLHTSFFYIISINFNSLAPAINKSICSLLVPVSILYFTSSITSASLVWWPGCQTASAKKWLRRIQRLARLGIMGARGTTPTSALEVLTGLPPRELVVQGKARSAAHQFWGAGLTSMPTVDVVPY
jgi:hypothetical protein